MLSGGIEKNQWHEMGFNAKITINFIQKETLAQMFSVNFAKCLTTPLLQNSSGRLFLFIN